MHCGLDSTMEEPRSRLDRTAIMKFFRESSKPSDWASCKWMITIARSRRAWLWRASAVRWEFTIVSMHHRRPCIQMKTTITIDDGWATMTIGRFRAFHVSSGKPLDHIHLLNIFRTWCNQWSRGLVSTRSTPCAWIRRMRCGHFTCKREIPWEHSPTRNRTVESKRLNRRAQSSTNCVTAPLSYQGPTIPVGPLCQPYLPRGAPHGRPRGPVCVASCHASVPPAPRVGQPWLCHVASVPRRIHVLVPRATSARHLGPLAMSSPAGNKSPFSWF